MINPLSEKYRNLIRGLLGTENFDLYKVSGTTRTSYTFVEAYQKEPGEPKEYIPFKYSYGIYELCAGDGTKIASWELVPMVNCCGIIVSTRAQVLPAYQKRGLGTLLNNMRMDIARELGYSVLLCTDVEGNTPQRKILRVNGWKDVFSFVNRRTRNTVHISVINL